MERKLTNTERQAIVAIAEFFNRQYGYSIWNSRNYDYGRNCHAAYSVPNLSVDEREFSLVWFTYSKYNRLTYSDGSIVVA